MLALLIIILVVVLANFVFGVINILYLRKVINNKNEEISRLEMVKEYQCNELVKRSKATFEDFFEHDYK